MRIDIELIPLPPNPALLLKQAVVVIDVLRATSVMVFAMSQGAREIIPVATVEEALQMAKAFPRNITLLGGERGSRKIEGFDMGNSPREYIAKNVKGKHLILTTTNGTKAFHDVSSGEEIMVTSFFNIGSTAQKCLELDKDLLLYPSGDEGNYSLEDTMCGGMLIDLIKKGKKTIDLTDAAQSAHILYQRFEGHLVEALKLSTHGRALMRKGFKGDLEFCAQIDITDIVPIFRDGVIRATPHPTLSPRGRGEG